MKKIVIFILSFVIILSSVTFFGCKNTNNSLDSITALEKPQKTEIEKRYLARKSYFDDHAHNFFGDSYSFLFLCKDTLTSSGYSHWYQQLGNNFEDLVLLKQNNSNNYICLISKGNCSFSLINLGPEKNLYYAYHDNYYIFNVYWVYELILGEPIVENSVKKSADGRILYALGRTDRYAPTFLVPDGITVIAGYLPRQNIEAVICNQELQIIGMAAFSRIFDLKEAYLNDGLKIISDKAFYVCKNLKQIIIPKSVEVIGTNAFTDTIVYCEAESKPLGWDVNFAIENAKVYYANEWHYDSNGKPVLNETETEII